MSADHISSAVYICGQCGGRCCHEAHPPLCEARVETILAHGDFRDAIEYQGYRRLKAGPDGECVMFSHGRCLIHRYKPETCVAGPFTFDAKGSVLEIYLKRESICPLVSYLAANPEALEVQKKVAIRLIRRLVLSLPGEELANIVLIPEPETDKVTEISFDRVLV
jgi:Fe-S-cluster containining protein